MKGFSKESLKRSVWFVAFAIAFTGTAKANAEALISGCWLALETTSVALSPPAVAAFDAAIKGLRYNPYRNTDARLLEGKGITHPPQEMTVAEATENAANLCASEIFLLDRQINAIPTPLRAPTRVNVHSAVIVYRSNGSVVHNQYLGMTTRRY